MNKQGVQNLLFILLPLEYVQMIRYCEMEFRVMW